MFRIFLTFLLLSACNVSFARSAQENSCFQAYWQSQWDDALNECQKAARTGSAQALMYLGDMVLNGTGSVQQNTAKAISLLEQSASKNFREAQLRLAKLYEGLEQQQFEGLEVDYEKAAKWYHRAATTGQHEAQYRLGLLYKKGLGVERDNVRAADLFRSAAEGGIIPAQHEYGLALEKGRGVERNDDEASIWFRKAAVEGYPPAEYSLAVMYHQGRGVEKNLREGTEWIKRSAEGNNPSGQFQLGILHRHGLGVEKNKTLAEQWIQKAAEQAYGPATYDLARQAFDNNDKEKGMALLQKAVEQKSPAAMVDLGLRHISGDLVDIDYLRASELFHQAALEGYGPAIYQYARSCSQGRGNSPCSQDEALQLYQEAANAGVADAQLMIGEKHKAGEQLEADPVKAWAWFYLAEQAGNDAAGFQRAMMDHELTPEQLQQAETMAQTIASGLPPSDDLIH